MDSYTVGVPEDLSKGVYRDLEFQGLGFRERVSRKVFTQVFGFEVFR